MKTCQNKSMKLVKLLQNSKKMLNKGENVEILVEIKKMKENVYKMP